MGVKIALTVDYEDVPREADAIIGRALSRAEKVVDLLQVARNTDDMLKKIEMLESIRQQLISVDANVEDGYNIYLGYTKHELQDKTHSEENNDK